MSHTGVDPRPPRTRHPQGPLCDSLPDRAGQRRPPPPRAATAAPTGDGAGAGGLRAEVEPEPDFVPSQPRATPHLRELRMLRPENDAGVAGRGLGAAGDGGAGEVAGAPRLERVRGRRSPRTPRAGGQGEKAGAVRDGTLREVTSARAWPVRGRNARRGRDEGGRRRRAELPAPTRACALATAEGGEGTRASAASAPARRRQGARAGGWRRSSIFLSAGSPGVPALVLPAVLRLRCFPACVPSVRPPVLPLKVSS